MLKQRKNGEAGRQWGRQQFWPQGKQQRQEAAKGCITSGSSWNSYRMCSIYVRTLFLGEQVAASQYWGAGCWQEQSGKEEGRVARVQQGVPQHCEGQILDTEVVWV